MYVAQCTFERLVDSSGVPQLRCPPCCPHAHDVVQRVPHRPSGPLNATRNSAWHFLAASVPWAPTPQCCSYNSARACICPLLPMIQPGSGPRVRAPAATSPHHAFERTSISCAASHMACYGDATYGSECPCDMPSRLSIWVCTSDNFPSRRACQTAPAAQCCRACWHARRACLRSHAANDTQQASHPRHRRNGHLQKKRPPARGPRARRRPHCWYTPSRRAPTCHVPPTHSPRSVGSGAISPRSTLNQPSISPQ